MSEILRCVRCGNTMSTQEALAGEVLNTAEGLMHEHCGDEFEVAENERRREEGDAPLIDWKLSGEQTLPADYDPDAQLNRYREMMARGRGYRIHEEIERAVRGDS